MSQVILLVGFMIVSVLCLSRERSIPRRIAYELDHKVNSDSSYSDYNELILSFVVFRHGDRTPDQEELDKFPSGRFNESTFHPFGKKALTNKGKLRAFLVGEYLRKRYNNIISQLYLPDEISVRTTDYARTKMTALAALAAMYPPPRAQTWSPLLNWQPIPYDTMSRNEDDLLYVFNCPRYEQLRNSIYDVPEIRNVINSYKDLFELLSVQTGANIKTPENVFYLDNLFQALNNSGISVPQWVEDVMPRIKEMTKIEYSCQFYNDDLRRLSTGVLMSDIIDAMNAAIAGDEKQAKLRIYSAHENNVAALLAGVRAFKPHQPKYGSTVSVELRKSMRTENYGVMVVYAAEAGGPGVVLPIEGCGGKPVCDYDTFITLTKEVLLPRSEYNKQCAVQLSYDK